MGEVIGGAEDTIAVEESDQDDGGEFVLMQLKTGDVFPPQSGQMQGGRHRRDGADFDQASNAKRAIKIQHQSSSIVFRYVASERSSGQAVKRGGGDARKQWSD